MVICLAFTLTLIAAIKLRTKQPKQPKPMATRKNYIHYDYKWLDNRYR